ncbi:MAG: helix-turn-helix domain-containing protein [Candidatus Kariarchaeaceae archaeon]
METDLIEKNVSIEKLLRNTGFFSSIQVSRILALMINDGRSWNAKEISAAIDVPDSKIYPALKNLENMNLISRDDTKRPNQFYFSDPNVLETFVDNSLSDSVKLKTAVVDELKNLIKTAWNPSEPDLGQIAYLYRNDSIRYEILRILKQSRERIIILISELFIPFFDIMLPQISLLLENGVRVEISLPKADIFWEGIKEFSTNPLLKIKTSLSLSNSYIVRDEKTLLHIIHRNSDNVALLTNDFLFIDHVINSWLNPMCCSDPLLD